MQGDRWQFWIDVGGTFTDCLARRPDGTLLRRKVLSSAVTKGQAAGDSTTATIIDPARNEPAGFWIGYSFRQFDSAGAILHECRVGHSLPGTLSCIPATLGRAGSPAERESAVRRGNTLTTGQGYELASPEEAPILAIRLFLGLRLDQPIPACVVRLGTTRGTNALLTRTGAEVGFVTTRGHADVLRIGYQNRPKLFELAIKKPEPLFVAVAEIDERMAADGCVLKPLQPEQVRAELIRLKAAGIESLAICLLNAYANPAHEEQVAAIAAELGFESISVSTQVSPLMKLVPRGDTTVVDAYLNPVLRSYVERLAKSLPGSDLRLMTSAGGLATAAGFGGKDSILSGPAGGVVGFSRVAQAARFERAIGFDMGGTSTDVSRFDGRFEYEYETEKAGVRIVAPMLAIETVAAGGGSICHFDGVKLVVGPDSAGADPGPACYGRGGPLTVTDCNFYLGRIVSEHFPFPLDRAAVEQRLVEVADEIRQAEESSLTLRVGQIAANDCGFDGGAVNSTSLPPLSHMECGTTLAEGFLRIANANMAQAIRSISLAKGYDPRDYVLVAFGSAGPQHACAVADELGIGQILLHPDSGVLSALGIGLADVVRHCAAGIYRPLDAAALADARRLLDELQLQASQDVRSEGGEELLIACQRFLELRYVGTDATLTIAEQTEDGNAAAFEQEHRRRYGYCHAGRALEIVAARVEAVGRSSAALPHSEMFAHGTTRAEPHGSRAVYWAGQRQNVSVFPRSELRWGDAFIGPAMVVEPLTTTIVEDGWQGQLLSGGELLLTRSVKDPSDVRLGGSLTLSAGRSRTHPAEPHPVLLELMSNHFTAIATQMGITLRNTAISVNVKERLDFSCAIFTSEGDLVVNAPHIPVHLGAMSQTVKQIIADNQVMQAGDVFVTNDPYRGGSHLPDVTVVTPVHSTAEIPQLLFFTASRAHHAEIGGITPGSMPPFSRNLAEEGVLIRNFKLLDAGDSRFEQLQELLSSGPYPSRSPETNLADITAQMAANIQGAHDLRRMIGQYSQAVVLAYMRHIQEAAERKLRAALAKLPWRRREYVDYLDDGAPICVAITAIGEEATIDFTGSGPVHAGNLNANQAIVTAAVMYVLRLLVGEDIPLNQGVLGPVKVIVPEGLLNPPERERPEDCAAVVGGNVETSQRVVDVLLSALKLAAASQGTMNNLLFGDATFGYYETICGGSGATGDADGADAVHTHMTNTRLTDPEVLEARYPVRLRSFSIRRNSHGKGNHRGGDGVIRQIEFLRKLTLSILSQRRGPYPPFGMNGGGPGAPGRNTLTRTDGTTIDLPGAAQLEVQPGDVLTIETPGGGGWG